MPNILYICKQQCDAQNADVIQIYIYICSYAGAFKFWSSTHLFGFDVHKSVHTIQIIQPTRCNSFTSLLLDVYVWLNMFRTSPSPSSGAYNCTRSLWFYRWRETAGVLLVMVWQVMPDHNQQRSSCFSPTVKPEAPSAVVCS